MRSSATFLFCTPHRLTRDKGSPRTCCWAGLETPSSAFPCQRRFPRRQLINSRGVRILHSPLPFLEGQMAVRWLTTGDALLRLNPFLLPPKNYRVSPPSTRESHVLDCVAGEGDFLPRVIRYASFSPRYPQVFRSLRSDDWKIFEFLWCTTGQPTPLPMIFLSIPNGKPTFLPVG